MQKLHRDELQRDEQRDPRPREASRGVHLREERRDRRGAPLLRRGARVFGGIASLAEPRSEASSPQGTYRSPRIEASASPPARTRAGRRRDDDGEIVCVVGYGRVPHKIPKRIPIGLALTLVSNDIDPRDRDAANKLAAQGLVTWMNYPTLAPEQGGYAIPTCSVDGKSMPHGASGQRVIGGARGVEEDRGEDHLERHHAAHRALRRRQGIQAAGGERARSRSSRRSGRRPR